MTQTGRPKTKNYLRQKRVVNVNFRILGFDIAYTRGVFCDKKFHKWSFFREENGDVFGHILGGYLIVSRAH